MPRRLIRNIHDPLVREAPACRLVSAGVGTLLRPVLDRTLELDALDSALHSAPSAMGMGDEGHVLGGKIVVAAARQSVVEAAEVEPDLELRGGRR